MGGPARSDPCAVSRPTRGSGPRSAARRARGFTLIEMIAVALMIALVASVAFPNLGFRSQQAVLDEAESVAALVEFARQRAVMTGIPQRVVFDLEAQHYWLEESRPPARPDDPADPNAPVRWSEQRELPMFAPRDDQQRYQRSPGPNGRGYRPASGVALQALETAEGLVERGRVEMPFAWDGSTEGTGLWLIGDGGHQVRLVVAPLADAIRIERVDG